MFTKYKGISNLLIIGSILIYCLLMLHFNWQNRSNFEDATGLSQLSQDQIKQLSKIPKQLKNWNVTWLGHNGYLLENKELKILLDPVHDPLH
jgi:hypothetical protein